MTRCAHRRRKEIGCRAAILTAELGEALSLPLTLTLLRGPLLLPQSADINCHRAIAGIGIGLKCRQLLAVLLTQQRLFMLTHEAFSPISFWFECGNRLLLLLLLGIRAIAGYERIYAVRGFHCITAGCDNQRVLSLRLIHAITDIACQLVGKIRRRLSLCLFRLWAAPTHEAALGHAPDHDHHKNDDGDQGQHRGGGRGGPGRRRARRRRRADRR